MSSPPTDFARIELFCDLVDEYDDLADAFPMKEPSLEIDSVLAGARDRSVGARCAGDGTSENSR